MLSRLITAILFLFSFSFIAYAEELSEDEIAIRHVVSEYVEGWRTGNSEHLARIFDLENGYIIWRSGEDGHHSIGSMTFGEALKRRRANPGYGEPYRIEDLDIVDGYLAVVRFNVERSSYGSYIDYFTLYKINGEWKIVVKAFTTRPGVVISTE